MKITAIMIAKKMCIRDSIRTVPVSARQRNLDFYIPSGFEAKIYDDCLLYTSDVYKRQYSRIWRVFPVKQTLQANFAIATR